MRQTLARLARRAPARVFVVEGDAPLDTPSLLHLHPGVEVVESPRSATILLLAGSVPDTLGDSVRRVHDQMAFPRCTVAWPGGAGSDRSWPVCRSLDGSAAELADRLIVVQADLVSGGIASDPAVLPDVEPAEWRGVGPYGQGGSGMTGGVPYGRPLAETAPDRDGLRLDRLNVRVGPWFPPFPPGLILALGLQGDVIQEVALEPNPFAGRAAKSGDRSPDPFRRALGRPVEIATMELARARHHLQWMAHALRVHGLGALGVRALALAEALVPGDVSPIAALRRGLERARSLAVATEGVGVLPLDALRERGLGPIARASGGVDDARAGDETYLALEFEPVTHIGGDARARWRQRCAEAEQSVLLAGRANLARAGGLGRVESPRGLLTRTSSPLAEQLTLIPRLLPGLEWGDAVAALVSLDLDLRDLPPEPPDVPAPADAGGRT